MSCLLPLGVAKTTFGGLAASELSAGLLRAGVGLLSSSSGRGLKMSGVPFGTAVKGLLQLDGELDEGSSEPEKSCSKSLVTVLGKGSGVCAHDGENVSSAVRKGVLKRSPTMGGSCSMAASLTAS